MNTANFLKRSMTALLALSLAACGSGTASTGSAEKKTYKVAVVKQLDHASLDEIADAITSELDALAEKNGVTIEYGDVYSGQSDPTTLQQIGSQVIANHVDAIIPIATTAAQIMTSAAEDTKTPVIFAAISDPESSGLTGIDYVTGTSDALNTEQIMKMIKAQNSNVKKVGLLYSKSEPNSAKPIEDAKKYLDDNGISYVEATGNTNDEVITAASSLIAAGVDAVFTPTDNVVMAAELSIAPMFAEKGIPHYTGADSFVRNGAFATCGVNYTDLGKETADLAYKVITEGIDKTDYYQSYEVMPGGIITVNTETAKELNADYSMFKEFGEIVEVTTTKD